MVFEQPHEHAQRCVGLLKEKGCEFIVALTHLSLVAWIDLIRCAWSDGKACAVMFFLAVMFFFRESRNPC